MAKTSDLMGLGTPPAPAGLIGHEAATVAGAGTTQAAAAKITTSVTLGTTATSQAAFVLPANMPLFKEFYFFNTSANAVAASVFAPGTGAINGATAAISVPQNKGAMFMCVAGSGSSAPQIVAILSA